MPSEVFEDEETTIRIPRETMLEARERSVPAHVAWGSGPFGEGFAPAGPDRPTRDIRVPVAVPEEPEITAVDGIPVAIDPMHDDTEPLLRRAS